MSSIRDLDRRVSFERALVRVRWLFLLAPAFLLVGGEAELRALAYLFAGMIVLYNAGLWAVLRSDAEEAARHAEAIRWLELAGVCFALTLLYRETGAPLYDALYVYFVVVITILSGRAGAYRAVAGATAAVLVSRLAALDAPAEAVATQTGFFLVIFALTAWSTVTLAARAERVRRVHARTRELAQAADFGAAAAGVSSTLDPGGLLREVVSEARRLFDAAGAYLALSRESEAPEVVAAEGSVRELEGKPLPVSESAAGRALRDREPVVGRVEHWSTVAVPLKRGSDVFGVLALRGDQPARFDRDDAALLSELAGIAATALANARLYEQIRSSEERLRKLFEAAAEAIITVDTAGRILSVNPAASQLLHRPRHDLMGRSLFDFMEGKDGERAHRALKTVAWGESPLVEVTLVIPGGGRRIAAITFAPLFEGDEVTAALLIARDVTEHKRLQQQLLERERLAAIGELIAGIAHDLNNPLTALQGFAEIAARTAAAGDGDDPKLREMLEAIHELSRRSSRLAQNLVDFARRQEAEREPVAPGELVEDAVRLLRYQFVVEEVDVRTEVEDDLPPVRVETSHLQQVLVNLGTNAVQAMKEEDGGDGHLLFTAGAIRDDDGEVTHVRFSVADSGPGVSDAMKEKIFDAFYTTKTGSGGTGLGLSISSGIVREHGGRLGVEDNEWDGATFSFALPATSEAGERADEPREEAGADAGREGTAPEELRILVVDDEAHIREFLGALLGRRGHACRGVGSAEDALAALDGGEFDVVICDLNMPGMSGRELEERLRERSDPAADRIVFTTGDTARGEVLGFLDGIGRPYLLKPFTSEEVEEAVERLAARFT